MAVAATPRAMAAPLQVPDAKYRPRRPVGPRPLLTRPGGLSPIGLLEEPVDAEWARLGSGNSWFPPLASLRLAVGGAGSTPWDVDAVMAHAVGRPRLWW